MKQNFKLTKDQQTLVEKNLSIVHWVIVNNIHVNPGICGLEYGDLFQEGCLWLCKAAFTYHAGQAQFSTYAKKVVKNGLLSYCRKICSQGRHVSRLIIGEQGELAADGEQVDQPDDHFDSHLSRLETLDLLEASKQNYQGVARLGIEALALKVQGIVLFNSIIIVTQSLDEEKWVNRVTRTDFNVYNSAAFNVMESVQHHEDTLSQQAVDLIAGQPGVEDERYLYRNTKDDRNVLVDYGFEDLSGIELFHEEEGVVNQSYQGYSLYTSSDTERRYFGNVMGASENFWADMCIFEGEKDAETLTQKMATGEYVIIGCPMDKLTEEPRNTPLTDQLQVGESISFYKDGELVKTSTILAKAILVGTETETPTGTTAQAHIAADAPFVYLPDTVFKEIYDAPTLLTYGFNVDEALQPQMEEFLSSYVSENTSVAYTSTKLLKEQLDSVRSMILVIGGLIGCIMAFAGLINFTNMIITNIITRRHEFATMQSIGMTGKQLRCLTVYEGIYYAVGADIIGGAVAAILAVTVLKSALNGPSMWFFTLNITLVPVLVIGVLYLLLAAVIPLIVLHFFNKGTVVERLRTSE